MRANPLTQKTLEATVGIAQPTVSAVLNGERQLTRDRVVTLARFFNGAPAAFLRGTPKA
jgi:plasmid maintenance system antidote protein VapI